MISLDFVTFCPVLKKIYQNVRSISIIEGETYEQKERSSNITTKPETKPTASKKIADWWSVSCELDENAGRISCTLEHDFLLNREEGDIRYGVEIIKVTKRGRRGRPIKLSSKVYHCIGAKDPHQIEVSYTRSNF